MGAAGFRHKAIYCKVHLTANQTISNTTLTTVNWDTEDTDTDTMHDNVTNNSRITVPIAGKYLVVNETQWGTSTGGDYRFANLYKNGTVIGVFGTSPSTISSFGAVNTSALMLTLAASDYLEIKVQQNSGGNLDVIGGGEANSHFTVAYIGE